MLTPWFNDPILDPNCERLYLRDEEKVRLWTPTPLPAGRHSACQVQHGPGQTTWRTSSEGLEQELSVFFPTTSPVKLFLLRFRILTPGARRLTATYYAEWLLRAVHGEQAPKIGSEHVVPLVTNAQLVLRIRP